jgi:putative spermidine/putrescine transport system permease protein
MVDVAPAPPEDLTDPVTEPLGPVPDPHADESSRPRMPWSARLLLAVPVAVLTVFFLGPFALMLRTSFYRRVQGGFYEPAFVLESWTRLTSEFYVDRTIFSILACAFVAAITVAVAFPFTWYLTRMRPRFQVPLLVLLLSALALSEVIVAFAWDLILGRSTGITNVLVWIGLMSEPRSYTPGFVALAIGLAYIAFPYCVLAFYPTLSRIDDELVEAATTLGAKRGAVFRTVVVPLGRTTLVAGFLLVFVFTLGSYIIAQVLGRPEHWTLSVFISDQAVFNSNIPFAAAIAIFLTVVSLVVVAITSRLARQEVAS